jgi:transglutaminase-like putative cysteine protease
MGRTAARLQWLAMGLLALGLTGVSPVQVLGALAIGLSVLTALKLLEARRLGERRLVALLQLVVAGLLSALQPDLVPSLLQIATMFVALAGLLALEVGEGPDWRSLLRRSMSVLLAALPMALVLLLLVPRMSPFSMLPILDDQTAVTGLSETLNPGSIAALADDTAPAARVSFPTGAPPAAEQRYWRVLVHDRFDGRQWLAAPGVRRLSVTTPETPGPNATGALQELWIVEPSGLTTVPWSGNGVPLGTLLRQDSRGELRLRLSTGQRRVYGIAAVPPSAGDNWREQPPRPLDLQGISGRNPRLEALGAQWSRLPTPRERLMAAERWFRNQGFRYSRTPGALPEQAPLDAFLFDRREGFCGHFAGSFSALMRRAGVPARVVSGFRGGSWVTALGGEGYLDLRRSDAHAWSEVWLPGEGWIRIDPSAWVTNPAPARSQAPAAQGSLGWLQRQWWAVDLLWTRWWLGFDRQAQDQLLRRLLGEQRGWVGALILVLVAVGLAAGLGLLAWLGRRGGGDPLRRELERSLALLARHGLAPTPGETLPRFLARVQRQWPALAADLNGLADTYGAARFAPPRSGGPAAGLRELRRRRRRLASELHRGNSHPGKHAGHAGTAPDATD